jgi:hypothetical protein
MLASSGHVTGYISAVALSFSVHEPSGIMVHERQVPVLQPLHVPQHLVLAVVAVEHRVRQIRRRPLERFVGCARPQLVEPPSNVKSGASPVLNTAHEIGHVGRRHRLVERHADRPVFEHAAG